MWNRTLKHHSSGNVPIDIATRVAVYTFNDGIKSVMKIRVVLGGWVFGNCLENDDVAEAAYLEGER